MRILQWFSRWISRWICLFTKTLYYDCSLCSLSVQTQYKHTAEHLLVRICFWATDSRIHERISLPKHRTHESLLFYFIDEKWMSWICNFVYWVCVCVCLYVEQFTLHKNRFPFHMLYVTLYAEYYNMLWVHKTEHHLLSCSQHKNFLV